MLKDVLIELFERDLKRLKFEVLKYENDNKLWQSAGEINNSAGNLVLHLCGNLSHFIGAVLGNTGYKREREKEFSAKKISVDKLKKNIDNTTDVVLNTINKLSEEDFAEIYPIKVFDKDMTTEFFLVHLETHLNYHLGQINYHRRLI